MPIAFHLNSPIWWKGCISTHSTFFMGATNLAMPSTLAGSSVEPGTSVKRTQTGFDIAARRSTKRSVGASADESGCLDRCMQAHCLCAREDAAGEGKLHQHFAARYGQAATD